MQTSYNFNNKTFKLLANSSKGKATDETVFHYQQQDDRVTATYSGGSIVIGTIIARLSGDRLHMLYQCLTTDQELMAGKATAEIRLNEQAKIHLKLHWQWLEDKERNGISEYVEI